MNRDKYEKIKNINKKWDESPNGQTYLPSNSNGLISMYDIDISQVIYPSNNYIQLKTMIRPKKWCSVAGTFL